MASKKTFQKCDPRAGVWALLSVVTFIVVFLAYTVQGFGTVHPFLFAGAAMFCTLALEGLARGKIWLFEPGYLDAASHHATSVRMMVFAGAFLLILETALLLAFATDPHFDGVMLRLIEQKHCRIENNAC